MQQQECLICLTQKFIGALKKNGVEINRKMLAELAARDIDGFKAVVDSVK